LLKLTKKAFIEAKKIVWGGEKSITSVKQRLAKLLPPRYLRPCLDVNHLYELRVVGLIFLLPLVVIIVCYTEIYIIIWNKWKSAPSLTEERNLVEIQVHVE